MSIATPAFMERVLLVSTAREADTQLTDRPDWKQVRTPSSVRQNHNKIIVAKVGASADEAIAQVVADHTSRGAEMTWFVGPSSEPADLGEQLVRHGFEPAGASLGMARRVDRGAFPIDVPKLTVRPVENESDLRLYADVSMIAWERDTDFRDAMVHIGRQALDLGLPTRSWIASIDGEPVATSHMRLLPECGYLQGCAVLPDRRRQGLYRAMVHHRLQYLRDEGIDLAVIWAARSTSGQGCLDLGFSTVCSGTFYSLTPKR